GDRGVRGAGGELVVHGAALLTRGHRPAHAGQHLAELGEHLAELGGIESGGVPAGAGEEAERVLRPALLAAATSLVVVALDTRIGWAVEAERQISHVLNGTGRTRGWAGCTLAANNRATT